MQSRNKERNEPVFSSASSMAPHLHGPPRSQSQPLCGPNWRPLASTSRTRSLIHTAHHDIATKKSPLTAQYLQRSLSLSAKYHGCFFSFSLSFCFVLVLFASKSKDDLNASGGQCIPSDCFQSPSPLLSFVLSHSLCLSYMCLSIPALLFLLSAIFLSLLLLLLLFLSCPLLHPHPLHTPEPFHSACYPKLTKPRRPT